MIKESDDQFERRVFTHLAHALIVKHLKGLEEMFPADKFHLTFFARHKTNSKAHMIVSSEATNEDMIRGIKELSADQGSTGDFPV